MRNQPPQLIWFKVKVVKAGKETEKRLLAISRVDAMKRANKILKYVPGSGDAKAIDAKEDT